MLPLALALRLAVAAPDVAAAPAPDLAVDPGPFRGGEVLLATTGALMGDALVVGSAYLALRLFADHAVEPSAGNFRTAAFVMGATVLLAPPLVAVAVTRLGASGPFAGASWKALLLASVGEAAALAAGWWANPHFWVVLPVQLVAVSLGTTVGLHWGPRRASPVERAPREVRGEPADPQAPPAAPTALRLVPVCPDV